MICRTTERIPARESQLREPVERLFSGAEYEVKYEVPFGLKRIDLFFRKREGTCDIVAVELKLRNWRGAVWQAVHNRQVAHQSYIALPAPSIKAVDMEILRCLGLGLISVDLNSATIFMQAKHSQVFNPKVASTVLTRARWHCDV